MQALNEKKPDSIEVWVQLNKRWRGHIEIKIGKEFFGFFADRSKKERVPDKKKPRFDNPIFGGYLGDLRRRDEDLLILRMAVTYLSKRKAHMVSRRDPATLAVPEFHVFTIPITNGSLSKVLKALENLQKHPVEYDIKSEENAKNCVTLSEDILRQGGILNGEFKVSPSLPSPVIFFVEMIKLMARNSDINYDFKRLNMGF